LDFVIRKNETDVYAEGFGDSSINLLVWFWIKYPGEPDFMTVRHKGVVAVKQALDEADISIPFPIRTLDFGIKGGEKLDAMISDKINQQSSNKGNAGGADSGQNE
jgi:small conductance mechanosensitive channel